MFISAFPVFVALTLEFLLIFDFLLLGAQQVALLFIKGVMAGEEPCAVVLVLLELGEGLYTEGEVQCCRTVVVLVVRWLCVIILS